MYDVISSTATLLNPQFNNAFNTLLHDALQLVLLGLSTLAAAGIAKWKASLNSKWKQAIAERAVKFVEQKFVDNAEKQKQAAEVISSHFPRMSVEEIQHLMEEAVFNMKTQQAAPVAQIAPEPSKGV